MRIWEVLLIAVVLSLDAFSVSVCKSLAMDRVTVGKMCIVGAWFGVFQALMPTIGYFIGAVFESYVEAVSGIIAFILLALIGINMIREAISAEEGKCVSGELGFGVMLMMAVATSIDALAVGVTFAMEGVKMPQIFFYVGIIGVTTFLISACGVRIGSAFGARHRQRAELCGGIILILLGVKNLVQNLIVLLG